MLYGSGLRVSELCALDIDSINAKSNAVTVMGKGSKERRVPVSEPTIDAIKLWMKVRREVVVESDPISDVVALFVNSRGKRLGTRDVRRILDAR